MLCATPGAEVGAELARGLVEARLADCVNVVPGLRSFHRWKGEVADDAEALLRVKTRLERFPALEARVKEHHPYEVPELVRIPIEGGSTDHLGWLDAQVAAGRRAGPRRPTRRRGRGRRSGRRRPRAPSPRRGP